MTDASRQTLKTPLAASLAASSGLAALRFEGFEVLPAERRLLVRGEPAKLGARAFDLLMALVTERGRVLGKDELLERVWPGLVVEENNLAVHVSQLRKVCGSEAISTIPGRGYQFTAVAAAGTAAPPRASAAAEEARLPTPEPQRGNLPEGLPALLGRESEQAEVLRLLEQARWVTITGAGGMGKTRLAEAVGRAMAERMPAWFVELASISDARFLPNAVAQTLGVTIIDVDQPLTAIAAALKDRPMLLILDNCEQLVGGAAALCRALLAQLPRLRVLVTSQELLHAGEETVYKLGPLSLPEPGPVTDLDAALATGALRLLHSRCQALSRHFEITRENVAEAVDICRQLDGLPLAIELAAGRVPMLGLAGVRTRLDERFRLLTGDARVRLRRHQTLRAALDWSYQLLSPGEQALLRRLGVCAGTFSVEGVEALAADLGNVDWGVLDTLASLIDKSLVQVKGQDSPRYLLLESTRAYAMEQLADCGETAAALAHHARATREVCRQATRRRDTQAIWDEVVNIRAAFDWALRAGEAELSVALVNESSVVLALGGLVGEVVQRLVAAKACVTPALPRPLAALYWQWMGRFGTDGRLPVARCVAALETAEAMFRELGNHRHVHACLRMRAEALLQQGELQAALTAIDAARQLEQAAASPAADRMRRLRVEGLILLAGPEPAVAIERLKRALDMAVRADIHRYVITLMQDIGQALLHLGDVAGAEAQFRAVLDSPRRTVTVALAEAYARMGLIGARLMQGQPGSARAAALEAVPMLQAGGLLLTHAELYAWLLAALGRPGAAATLLATADTFRCSSQTARGLLQTRACAAARALLGSEIATGSEPIVDEAALAALLNQSLG